MPLLVAALTVPKLLALIGSERFGYLALAWGLIGYAGALDLGIGRAVTQKISALRGGPGNAQIPDVVATATRITVATGLVGMLLIAVADLAGAYRFVNSATVPGVEVELSLLMLALALPMQAVSATFRGVNEAYLNFKNISILRLLLGVANFGGPFLVALYSTRLHLLVATLVLSRLVALVCYRHFAGQCLRDEGHLGPGRYRKPVAADMLGFGGWFTVSSIVSPFLVQADRFFVGALISATAVTMYVIPYEVAVQTLLLVSTITTISFPVITNLLHSDPDRAAAVFKVWLGRVMLMMAGVTLFLALIMPTLLRYWIGPHVTDASVNVGRILCAGVFFNSMGSMYFALLHASGKTRATALLHLVELPFFAVVLYLLIVPFGVEGAAMAWVLRMMVDGTAMALISRRVSHDQHLQRSLGATG